MLDALAPSNAPLTNPAVLKATLDTGGRNFVRGAANFARDMAKPPRIPSMVDTSAFTVGEDIAVTPGAVVLRTPVFELLQYKPQTSKVREQPLLLTPPMINKYYIADLAPGRSMMEYAVKHGQQVFAISWRNPTERHADWDLDTYARRRARGARRRRGDHRRGQDARDGPVRGRHRARRPWWRTSPPRASRTGSPG